MQNAKVLLVQSYEKDKTLYNMPAATATSKV